MGVSEDQVRENKRGLFIATVRASAAGMCIWRDSKAGRGEGRLRVCPDGAVGIKARGS